MGSLKEYYIISGVRIICKGEIIIVIE